MKICGMLLLVGVLSGCATAIRPAAPAAATAHLAIVGATVVDTETGHLLRDHTVLIAGDHIQAVGPRTRIQVPVEAQVVDALGKYLIPGLIDTHAHFGATEGNLSEAYPILRFLLANGVTATRDAHGAGRERDLVLLRGRVEGGEVLLPRLYVSGTANLENVKTHEAVDLRDLVRRLDALGVDGIKIIYTSRDEALAVIAEAEQVGLPVYGHTWIYGGSWYGRPDLDFDFDGYTLDAVQAGLSGIMHAHSSAPQPARPMPPPPSVRLGEDSFFAWWLHTRSRWLYATTADLERLMGAMLAQGTWLEPNLIVDDGYAHPERYRPYVADAHLGQPVAEFMSVYAGEDLQRQRAALERQREFVRLFYEAGGLVLAGSDNHPAPGFGLHDEMRLLVEAGLPPLAALQAATQDAVRAFGWQERLGTISPGKLADLVLLEANPLDDIRNTRMIHSVVLNGHLLEREDLDALLTPAPW
jgi:imidazolonepropionase-like amidohydrolase